MAKRGRRRWHGLGGVLAAYLVVLQAAISGLMLGAAPVVADPFSVICNTQAGETAPGAVKHKGGLPGCCVAGCQMLGGGMAPPPAAAQAVSAPVELASGATPELSDSVPLQAERLSSSARAPPARS